MPALFCLVSCCQKNILWRASANSRHKTKQAGWQGSRPCLPCFGLAASTCSSKWVFYQGLVLYSETFQKCLINYLGLSYEQTVTSQLFLLVKHNIIIIEIVVVYYDLYDIHEKFEYSCDVTNTAHAHPLLACLLCLKGPTFLFFTN